MVNFDICEGNIGALTFVIEAYEKHLFIAETAFQRMQEHQITGAKLYMLWNDCCDRDTEYAVIIMNTKPIDDIIQHINYERGRGIPYKVENKKVK